MVDTNNLDVSAESQDLAQPDTGSDEVQPDAQTDRISGTEEDTQPVKDVSSQDELDSFTKGVDPEKLSPELKTIYKSMQSDYTKKMQDLKQIQSVFPEYERAAQILNQLASDPEFQKWRESEVQRRNQTPKEPEPDFDNMSEDERYEYIAKKVAKETEDRLRNEFQQTYGTFMNKELEAKAMGTINEFKTKHPEAKNDELAKLAPVIKAHNLTLDQAYAMTYPDRVSKQALEKARQELYVKKQANLETGNLPGDAAPNTSGQPMSVQESWEMSKRQANK